MHRPYSSPYSSPGKAAARHTLHSFVPKSVLKQTAPLPPTTPNNSLFGIGGSSFTPNKSVSHTKHVKKPKTRPFPSGDSSQLRVDELLVDSSGSEGSFCVNSGDEGSFGNGRYNQGEEKHSDRYDFPVQRVAEVPFNIEHDAPAPTGADVAAAAALPTPTETAHVTEGREIARADSFCSFGSHELQKDTVTQYESTKMPTIGVIFGLDGSSSSSSSSGSSSSRSRSSSSSSSGESDIETGYEYYKP